MIPGGKNIAETLYLSLERGAQSARPLASIIKYGQLSENELALLEKSLSRLGLQAKEIEQVLAETLKKYKVEESTAKHRTAVLLGYRVRYLSYHFFNNVGRNVKASVGIKLREIREILTVHCKDREGSLARADEAIKSVIDLNRDLILGKNSDGLIESLRVDYVLTLALDGYCVERRSYTLIHIIGRYLNLAVLESLDENALNRRNGVFIGYRSHSGGKLRHKIGFKCGEFHILFLSFREFPREQGSASR
jgi:hypothetical protein